jgi:peptidoglycan/LPS O-acetylase OafA/YrhL
MRVLSIVWVVYLHTNFLSFFQPNMNAVYRDEWAQNLFTMIYHTGDIAVDTFLVMAGLLVAWQFFKEREQK